MSPWRPLPDTLDTDTRLLVERLRALKQSTGLSLDGLARRTAYSKSAWHRYLNGEKPTPSKAVEALGRIAGADQRQLLALHGASCRARSAPPTGVAAGPAAPCPPPPPAPCPAPAPPARERARWWMRFAAVLALVCATLGAAASSPQPSSYSAYAVRRGAATCHGAGCQGRYPGSTACAADARTRGSITEAAYTVRLRWSQACGTVWTVVRSRSAPVRRVSVRTGADNELTTYPRSHQTVSSSPMLAASTPRQAEGCAEVDGRLDCTGAEEPVDTGPLPCDTGGD